MPLYEFKCLNCGTVNEYIIGLSELPTISKNRKVSLKKLNLACKRCRSSDFYKMLSAHGKMSDNWSSWQSSPKPPPTPKKRKSSK